MSQYDTVLHPDFVVPIIPRGQVLEALVQSLGNLSESHIVLPWAMRHVPSKHH